MVGRKGFQVSNKNAGEFLTKAKDAAASKLQARQRGQPKTRLKFKQWSRKRLGFKVGPKPN